jgi:hypothetical protein
MANDRRSDREVGIPADLLEYFVVSIPDPEGIASICAELVRLVEDHTLRILDVVVLSIGADGRVDTLEVEAIEGLRTVTNHLGSLGAFASRHDISLVGMSLRPGSCAVLVVAEDRWAERLSVAARELGGSIVAGERIARERAEAAIRRTGPVGA